MNHAWEIRGIYDGNMEQNCQILQVGEISENKKNDIKI